jgi:endogenous inhibitor of DNA gyrase (YacG/DUF329 family)
MTQCNGMTHFNGMKHVPNEPSASRPRRCPICGKPAVPEFRAFCSRRCADVDLNRWLSDVYVVPGKAEEAEDGEPGSKSEDEA